MIKGAVIGLGKMGISHASILGAHPDVQLSAVCDTSSFVLSGFNKFSKLNTYTDYKKMIDKEDLDFVVVSTPTKFHYPVVKYALDKGLNVFCEKPFMLTIDQGKEIVELSEKKQVIAQTGYHNHFIGTFRHLRHLMRKKILGRIIHFSGEAYGPVVTKKKAGNWRANKEEGGGCLYDYASHVINLIQEIIGKVTTVHGSLLKSFYSDGVEDAVYSLLETVSGISGTLLVNWSDETYRKMSTSITVYGEKGKIICDATELKIYLKEKNEEENLSKGWNILYITDLALPVDFYLRGEEYSAQLDYFIGCIKENKPVEINTFREAFETDQAIHKISLGE